MGGKIFLFWVLTVFFLKEAEALALRQEMDVSVGVFDAAKVDFFYEEKGGKFDINAEVMTDNLFGALYFFKAKYESRGRILKDGVLPESYQTHTKTKRHVRTKKIFYDKAGKAYQRVSSKDNKEHTVMITDVPKTAAAADLQTVFAELIGKFHKTGGCGLEREVYDGKKHYNVVVKDMGTVKRWFDFLKKEEKAKKCQVYIENLKNNNDNILWDVSAEKPINFWVGTDEYSEMPYILEIRIDSTPLGELKVLPKTLEIK